MKAPRDREARRRRSWVLAAAILFGGVLVESFHAFLGDETIYQIVFPAAGTGGISDEETRGTSVSEADFTRYVDVLASMHANHDLDVEEAAALIGLTLEEFRSLERNIQRSSHLVERAREKLQSEAERLWAERLGSPAAASES